MNIPFSQCNAGAEGRVVTLRFLRLLPGQRNGTAPNPVAALPTPGCSLWLLLEFGSCVSKLSRSTFSHHECSLTWGCPAGCGCCGYAFAFHCFSGQVAESVLSPSLSVTTTPSFSVFLHSQGFHLLASPSGLVTSTQILIHAIVCSISFAEGHTKVSN